MATKLRKFQPEYSALYIPPPLEGYFPTWDAYWQAAEKRLAKRKDGFIKIFEYLFNLKDPTIVETGTYREANNYEGDGCSTLLFDNWLNYNEGTLYSVDLNKEACDFADSETTHAYICNSDSVDFLSTFSQPIDLLYLDSYNITDWNNDWAAASHHLKELFVARPLLKEGSLIVVDDNLIHPVSRMPKGKGRLVSEVMEALNIEPYINDYQMAWIWPG